MTHHSNHQKYLSVTVSSPGWVDSEDVQYLMPPAQWVGPSFSFVKTLKAGEIIDGSVETLSPQAGETGRTGSWSFEILDWEGGSAQSWQGQWRTNNSHQFNYTVPSNGVYRIRVTNNSDYQPILFIRISPTGWAYRES